MNFDFNRAGNEAQHIARFMDMVQDFLERIQPVPEGKEGYIESIYSLVLVSERIAQDLVEQFDALERDSLQV